MKKYWIIVDGQPVGPFTSSELKVRRDFSVNLPVWSNDLPDWSTVANVPELACLLETDQTVEAREVESDSVREQGQSGPVHEQPQQSVADNTSRWIPQNVYAATAVSTQPRPKTFIGWNIAMLFCCCLVGGVIGIVFGSQVNGKWERGDYEGARRASEIAEWCVIISFVLGLVCWPFQAIFL